MHSEYLYLTAFHGLYSVAINVYSVVYFFQLKFYALSGHSVEKGRNLAEVYYALDGQFVTNARELHTSNCIGVELSEPTNTTFLGPNVELIDPALLIPYYAMFVVSFVVYWLIMISANKFINGDAVIDHQSVPFLFGLLYYTTALGMVITSVEIWSFFLNCSISVHVIWRKNYLIVVNIIIGLFLLWKLIRVYRSSGFSTSAFLKLFFSPVIAYISTFLFVWLLICLFPTLLYGFAYPLNTLLLVVVHVAFVFAVTVAFAAVLSDVIFWINSYGSRHEIIQNRIYLCVMIKDLLLVLFLMMPVFFIVFGCLAYGGFIIGLTVVQGFVTSDGANAFLPLIPSLGLFLIGWLIKRRFFADTGKDFSIV